MRFFYDFYNDLKEVFKICREIISKYPEGLNDAGLKNLKRYNVFEENASKNYICYLLSFWINDKCHLKKEICIKITVANIFMMLFAFIQDDIIDREIEDEDIPIMIILGNLYFSEFMFIYREVFKGYEKIWDYYNFYMKKWSKFILDEKININNSMPLDSDKMVSLISGKAELIKIAVAAICILAKKEELLDMYFKAVDRVLFSLQVADDYIDWKKDLKRGNGNILLKEFTKKRKLKCYKDIREFDVKEEMIFGSLLNDLYMLLVKNSHKLDLIIGDKNMYIKEFNDSILKFMKSQMEIYLERRKEVKLGGFFNWVDKNIFNKSN